MLNAVVHRTETDRSVRFVLAAAVAVLIVSAGPVRPLVAQSSATYTVEFNATWSAQSHPNGFPSNPHFSGLIGGTHNGSVSFWNPGELASPGIERMAETGSKSPLRDEVQSAIDAGTAGAILSGGGIGTSPNSVTLDFEISEDHSLVTLVSMLAPSPDWFVGVHGLSLFEDGRWLGLVEVALSLYDSGTDSGANYTSGDQDTDPPEPIALFTAPPFDQNGVVGTLQFRRTSVTTSLSDEQPDGFGVSKPYPNPTSDVFRLDIDVDRVADVNLRIFDVTGRSVLERTVSAGGGIRSVELSLTELVPGMYFVETTSDEHKQVSPVLLVR